MQTSFSVPSLEPLTASLQLKQQNLPNIRSSHTIVRLPNNLLTKDKDDQEIQRLFNTLDIDKDGVLSHTDLEMSFKKLKLPPGKHVEIILEKCGNKKTGTIDYQTFSQFLGLQKEHLQRVITQLDHNDYEVEIQTDIIITTKENKNILLDNRKEKQQAMIINWEHLLLAPEPTWDGFSQYLGSNLLMESMSANLSAPKLSNALNYLFAGGLAGAVSRTSTAPLDRLKLLLQIQRAGVYQEYRGLLSGLSHIYREGGITAFFRGNGTNIVKIVPESAVKFYTYEQTKKFLSKNDDTPLSLPLRFVAGATAGLTSQLFIYPLECVKTRLAISPPGTYSGIFNCIATMYQKEGLRSLFRGLRPALLGVVPYSGIDLTIYETLKNLSLKHSSVHQNHPQTKRKNEKDIGVLTLLGCGIISSSIGQLVSYPLSLARTRLQAQGLPGHPVIYHGMKDVFVKTLRTEGILGLYRGIVPNFVKVAPAVSISYAVYESTKNFLAN